jgi:AcrR family transcriptional regulator
MTPMTVDEATLTPSQIARRARVLDAAMALASEGGYDAVQMRDVASRAQVALGTIYRYFASKDHLLAECQLETWRTMQDRLAQRPLQGHTAADRVIDLIQRVMRSVAREPQQAAALITGSSSPDPAVRDCQAELVTHQDAVLTAAMGSLDPRTAADVARTLRSVWFSVLLGWVNGWNDFDAITDDFSTSARLLLGDAA